MSSDFSIEPSAKPDPVSDSEIVEEVNLALAQIRDEYRECFVLFYQQELACTQISEILGCPVGTVKTWLHRARKEVADRLKRRGITGEIAHEVQ